MNRPIEDPQKEPTATDIPEISDMAMLLQHVAQYAGQILRDNAFSPRDIQYKKPGDPVTDLDKLVEKVIKEKILERMPANFIGEEYGLEANGADYTFIIDPIDGTKSFIRKDFHTSISIAVEKDGEIIAGCIYDFMRDIMYTGTTEQTFCSYAGYPIPSTKRQIGNTKILIEGEDPKTAAQLQSYDDISTRTRVGSIALAMALLSEGSYEGMIIPPNNKGNVWDVAAGYFLLKQKGYHVTDYDGVPFNPHNQSNGLIALHPDIADKVTECLKET
ncbi:inositol monophosphatase family protein [Nanoarchaeota archaeon]